MRSGLNAPAALLIVALVLCGSPAPRAKAGDSPKDVRSQPVPGQSVERTGGDAELTRRIRDAIAKDRSLSQKALNIDITTVDGAVTLRGAVMTSEEKSTLVAKARDVSGVKSVDDQLEVSRRSSGE